MSGNSLRTNISIYGGIFGKVGGNILPDVQFIDLLGLPVLANNLKLTIYKCLMHYKYNTASKE